MDEALVRKVADWILAGIRPSQVPEQLAKVGAVVIEGDVSALLDSALALVMAEATFDLRGELAKAKARYELLFQRALAVQDYGTAFQVQKQIDALVIRGSRGGSKGGRR